MLGICIASASTSLIRAEGYQVLWPNMQRFYLNVSSLISPSEYLQAAYLIDLIHDAAFLLRQVTSPQNSPPYNLRPLSDLVDVLDPARFMNILWLQIFTIL